MEPTRKKALIYIVSGIVLMFAGAAGLAVPWLAWNTASDFALLEAGISDTASVSATATAEPDPNRSWIKDRLIIPKAGVNMALAQGTETSALWKGGWLYPNTSLPGQGGNTVVFGHRFRFLPPVSNTFFNLDKLAVGDRFTVRWQGSDYEYLVRDIRTVEPTDFSVVASTIDERITLVTCAPTFSTKYRLVVTAGRVLP